MTDVWPERCPVHAGKELGRRNPDWPCPDDCEHFLAALDRNIVDIMVHGNFTRLIVIDGDMYRQQYRNHEPFGEPVLWRPKRGT